MSNPPVSPADDPTDQWLAARHRKMGEELSTVLDIDAGLREVMLVRRHTALLDDMDDFLDVDAGLADILLSAAPEPVGCGPHAGGPGPAGAESALRALVNTLDVTERLSLLQNPLTHAGVYAQVATRALTRAADYTTFGKMDVESLVQDVALLRRLNLLQVPTAPGCPGTSCIPMLRDGTDRDSHTLRHDGGDSVWHIADVATGFAHWVLDRLDHALAAVLSDGSASAAELERSGGLLQSIVCFFGGGLRTDALFTGSPDWLDIVVGTPVCEEVSRLLRWPWPGSLDMEQAYDLLADFTEADMTGTDLAGRHLDGVRWSQKHTRWPACVDVDVLKTRSTEMPEGSGIYVVRGGTATPFDSRLCV